ncbi:hypothetical protein SK128_019737, partial [Halocaridina rubra]
MFSLDDDVLKIGVTSFGSSYCHYKTHCLWMWQNIDGTIFVMISGVRYGFDLISFKVNLIDVRKI